jgi:hypothetical protein
MGRGQASEDGFQALLGARRGSASAQLVRDRAEALVEVREAFSREKPLRGVPLLSMQRHFDSDWPPLRAELREQILGRIQEEGLANAAQSLGRPFGVLSLLTRELLVDCVVEHLSRPVTDPMDIAGLQAQAGYVLRYAFDGDRSVVEVAADGPLAEALLGLARKSTAGARALVKCLVRQSTPNLILLSPWAAALEEGLRTGRLPIAVKDMRKALLADHSSASPERQALLEGLCQAVSSAVPLTMSQMAVLECPAWDDRGPMRKEDLASFMAGEGPEARQAAAHRVLGELRSEELGLVEIWPSPNGGRLNYCLSTEGHILRRALRAADDTW